MIYCYIVNCTCKKKICFYKIRYSTKVLIDNRYIYIYIYIYKYINIYI